MMVVGFFTGSSKKLQLFALGSCRKKMGITGLQRNLAVLFLHRFNTNNKPGAVALRVYYYLKHGVNFGSETPRAWGAC